MLTDEEIERVRKLFHNRKPFNTRSWGLILVRELKALKREVRKAQIKGIKLAADVAKDYDKYNTHPYLVSDCILGKLNVLKGTPRRNKDAQKVELVIRNIERKLSNIETMTHFMGNAEKLFVLQRSDGPSLAQKR